LDYRLLLAPDDRRRYWSILLLASLASLAADFTPLGVVEAKLVVPPDHGPVH
jgi:hypothetical protein